MPEQLRLLMLEDNPADADLMQRALKRAGVSFVARHVVLRDDFVRELAEFAPDAILADFRLPGFDGLAALELARKLGPAVPFIIVTGLPDEETAAACLKAGATDYVLKDHLVRLPAAVVAAVAARRARVERRRAEEAYQALAESALLGLVIFQERRIVFVNQTFCDLVGWSEEELLAAEFERYKKIVHVDDGDLVWGRFRDRTAGKPVPPHYEFRVVHRDGSVRWIEMYASNVLYLEKPAIQAALIDITQRKQAEDDLCRSRDMLRHVVGAIPVPFFWKDCSSVYLGANGRFAERVGTASPEAVVGRADQDLCWTAEQAAWLRACDEAALAARGPECAFRGELRFADGRTLAVRLRLAAVVDETGKPCGVTGVFDE